MSITLGKCAYSRSNIFIKRHGVSVIDYDNTGYFPFGKKLLSLTQAASTRPRKTLLKQNYKLATAWKKKKSKEEIRIADSFKKELTKNM